MSPRDEAANSTATIENPIEREHYGSQTLAVEPGGVDVIPLSSRHGTPRQLLWTWTSPNLEFATVGVGILRPWLGVVLVDRFLRRGTDISAVLTDRTYRNWAGPIAMLVGMAMSIWLFSHQQKYVGLVPAAHPNAGDLTFEVGFVIAAVLYAVLVKVLPPRSSRDLSASAAQPTHG